MFGWLEKISRKSYSSSFLTFLFLFSQPDTRATVLMSNPNIPKGGDFTLNSFVGHEFEVRELPSVKTGLCDLSDDQTCLNAYFVVSGNDDQIVTVDEGFAVEFLDDQVRAQNEATDIVVGCHEKAKLSLEKAGTNVEEIQKSMDFLLSCVEGHVASTLSKANEEVMFQSKIRTDMAKMMENYTCVDTELNTTEALRTEYWQGAKDRQKREVQVLLDRPASKIMFVEDFISIAECDAMAAAAKPHLAIGDARLGPGERRRWQRRKPHFGTPQGDAGGNRGGLGI